MSATEVDTLEILDSKVKNYEEEIGGLIYVQEPLSFFGKIELFSVLANAIEKALADGAIVSELLGELPSAGAISGDLSDSDVLIRAVAKITKYAPETLKEIYAISFKVGRSERELFFIDVESVSDEQGMRILNQFIDQNWDAIMDFFKEQVKPLIANVSGKLQPSNSTSSKSSKPSRQRTKSE